MCIYLHGMYVCMPGYGICVYCIYVYCVNKHVYICVCIEYVCVYVCMYVYMCVYIHTTVVEMERQMALLSRFGLGFISVSLLNETGTLVQSVSRELLLFSFTKFQNDGS